MRLDSVCVCVSGGGGEGEGEEGNHLVRKVECWTL